MLLLLQDPPPPPPRPPFVEAGSRSLPGVSTTCGSPAKDFIVEANGGGLVLGDFDGDARADLVVIDGSTLERIAKGEPGFPPRLFLGRGDGTFAPGGAEWAMAGGRWGMGGAAGDLDGDGWLDLVTHSVDGGRVRGGPLLRFAEWAGHAESGVFEAIAGAPPRRLR